jgi:DNA-directed RNA polymerase specialized sigma24 family protein
MTELTDAQKARKFDQIAELLADPLAEFPGGTPRQREALTLRTLGLSKNEVAEALSITPETVRLHQAAPDCQTPYNADRMPTYLVRKIIKIVEGE